MMNNTTIPDKFKIANTWYTVEVVDKIDRGDYGYHDDVRRKIVIAKQVPTEQGDIDLEEGQIENTFWHELFHVFNFYFNTEQDEALAQTFANFMCEYLATKRVQ